MERGRCACNGPVAPAPRRGVQLPFLPAFFVLALLVVGVFLRVTGLASGRPGLLTTWRRSGRRLGLRGRWFRRGSGRSRFGLPSGRGGLGSRPLRRLRCGGCGRRDLCWSCPRGLCALRRRGRRCNGLSARFRRAPRLGPAAWLRRLRRRCWRRHLRRGTLGLRCASRRFGGRRGRRCNGLSARFRRAPRLGPAAWLRRLRSRCWRRHLRRGTLGLRCASRRFGGRRGRRRYRSFALFGLSTLLGRLRSRCGRSDSSRSGRGRRRTLRRWRRWRYRSFARFHRSTLFRLSA